MKQTSGPLRKPAEMVIKNIRRATRRQFTAEEKIRIVLEGLRGDTARAATSDEVKDLRREASALKEVVADLTLENRPLKKA